MILQEYLIISKKDNLDTEKKQMMKKGQFNRLLGHNN